MKTIQLTLLNKPGKWAFVKHLLFVSSEPAAFHAPSIPSQGLLLLSRVPVPAVPSYSARVWVTHSLIPLLCSFNISSTSEVSPSLLLLKPAAVVGLGSEWALCPQVLPLACGRGTSLEVSSPIRALHCSVLWDGLRVGSHLLLRKGKIYSGCEELCALPGLNVLVLWVT